MQGKLETRVGLFVLAALAIFCYMGFQIGAFRFDRSNYANYTMYFNDISGLTRKAEVKIAGVKVGWVEKIELISDHQMKAKADVMVSKHYTLYNNAHAVVRQEGLLGPKYLEIAPGDPMLPKLAYGDTLNKPGVAPVSVDDLLHKFKNISTNVEEITDSLKDVMGGESGKEQLKSIINNLNYTAEHMASFSEVLDRSFAKNSDGIDAILSLGTDIRRVTDKLENDILPSVKTSIERISESFDRDFDRVATTLTATASALEEASLQAREGFSSIGAVAHKIDEGKGLIGKLVNDDETYKDLKVAVSGLKSYFSSVDKLQVVLDGHSEFMGKVAENYTRNDQKFYLDVRIHPDEDYFYMVGVVSSLKGWAERYKVQKSYTLVGTAGDERPIDASVLDLDDKTKLQDVYTQQRDLFIRNTLKLDAQIGKIFKDIALRFGLFEGSGGMGIDFDIPVRSERFRWVTSFEIFDWAGWNRRDDERPHLKWINRMYVMNNIYVTFGADDFVSRNNANAFFGMGLRFGDDNAKYLMQSAGGGLGAAGVPGYYYVVT
ncbi:MAG: MlaD family protein [Candidatus Babeliales bacterium]